MANGFFSLTLPQRQSAIHKGFNITRNLENPEYFYRQTKEMQTADKTRLTHDTCHDVITAT